MIAADATLHTMTTGDGAILLAFGWMMIGSLFIIGGWFRQGWRRRIPYSAHNAALMLAIGLELHSAGMALQLGGRIEQILIDGRSFATDDPVYWAGVALTILAKTFFVWVAALGPQQSYSKPYVGAYWASFAAWAAFVAWWMT